VAALTVLATLAAAALQACSNGPPTGSPPISPASADTAYGTMPSFLPPMSNRPDAMLTGSPGRPAVTSEGDVVAARVGAASVQVEVDGPVVPGEGLPEVTPATTCTWKVTFSHATTTVPILVRGFSTVDEQGHHYRPGLVTGQPRPPATIHPGQRISFPLRAVMPTGEGVMRWAPGAGSIVAIWDFVVEND
jgi:hypothetical protein